MTTASIAPRPRVLVVDDHEPVRTALARTLRRSCSAATAPNARAALKLLSEEPFDAVLTDYDMAPGPNGLWLLVEVTRHHQVVRRFLMTGDPVAQFEPFIASGVIEACFQKPLVGAVFVAALGRAQ